MKIYDKNDFTKFYKKQDPSEIIDSYISTFRKSTSNSTMNSTAFNECQKSIGKAPNSSRINILSIHTKEDPKTKYTNYTNELKYDQSSRLNIKEENQRKNINVTNIKYNDIRNTLPIMSFLPRFKSICKYNKATQELINTPRTNPIRISSKIIELNKYVYQ